MKLYRLPVLAVLLLVFYSNGFAQIGINTITPDSSASLHIVSKPSGSGLIIPELTEAQRLAIHKPAKGLMVFDLTANLFYMNMDTAPGNNWYAINPWLTKGNGSTADVMYTSPVVSKVGIGVQIPQATLDVNGDIKASTTVSANAINVNGFSTNALVPNGAIMMWSGDPLTLPAGWALCDGTTYGTLVTPDLRGRFIVGFDKIAPTSPIVAPADGTTINYGAVKNTGGETGHTLDTLETALVRHTHASPPHQHPLQAMVSGNNNNSSPYRINSGDASSGDNFVDYTDPQTVTINAAPGQNASKPHENRPPYYVLAYIIKLP